MNHISHSSLLRAFALALLMSPPAAAIAQVEWIALGRNENFRAYLDQLSVQRDGDRDRVRVFQLADFVTAQWVDERTVVGSLRSRIEYDCREPRSRVLLQEAYSEQMGEGRLVASEATEGDWEGIRAGSTHEKVRALVCRR